MKKRCVNFLFIILYLASVLQAQTYASLKLAEIGKLFPKTCIPPKDSIFDCPQIISSKSFIIQYDAKGEVVHLGIALFSPETKQMINTPVCNFIERLTLELLLQKTEEKSNKKMNEYQVKLEGSSHANLRSSHTLSITELLNFLRLPVRFALHQEEETYYASWLQETGDTYVISFPASRELIFGTNKKESDIILGKQLLENRCEHLSKENISVKKNELEPLPSNNTVFFRKGGEYILSELNADTYYIQNSDNNFIPVTDVGNPALFLKNLLLIPQLKTTLKIHIKHRMYGNFTPEFEIKPHDFNCFFQPEFDIYCHVDDSKEGLLKATIVLHNRMFNYMHLLSITTSEKILFQENGVLEAEFFSNIPQHNIKNLFDN